jgi:hypothetical protein
MALSRALVLALVVSSLPCPPARAVETSPATAQARLAADAAAEQLVELRRALWLRLTPVQKTAFADRERAWLNGGRTEEEQRCVDTAPTPSPLVVQQCRLAVAERHRALLSAPIVQANAGR